MQISPDQPSLLIELGFTPADLNRSHLPKVQSLTQQQLQGRLYHRISNPVSHDLFPESGSPIRIQNLNIPQLAKLLGQPIFPVVLQPETISFDQDQQPLVKPWNPLPMPAQKHFGYAMQWFSMAMALLIIGLVLLKRQLITFPLFLRIKRSIDELFKYKK